MTRSMNSRLDCPTCGCKMTMETHFERWLRSESLLDSSTGIVRYDLDLLLHKYMEVEDGFGKRDIQALMFVEVKTWGAVPSTAQRDTLHLLSQALRNRRKNINGDRNKWNLKDHSPIATAMSIAGNRDIQLRMYGGHLLTFEKDGPDNSDWIKWNRHFISRDQLVDLLRFRIEPENPLLKMDIRRRSKPLPLFDRIGQ